MKTSPMTPHRPHSHQWKPLRGCPDAASGSPRRRGDLIPFEDWRDAVTDEILDDHERKLQRIEKRVVTLEQRAAEEELR